MLLDFMVAKSTKVQLSKIKNQWIKLNIKSELRDRKNVTVHEIHKNKIFNCNVET